MPYGSHMATEIRSEVVLLVNAAKGEAEMTRTALAEATGIPYSTLGRKLNGDADFTFEELYRCAIALGKLPSAFTPHTFIPEAAAA